MAKNLMIRYVFETKPNEVKSIIRKYGVSPAKDKNDLWKKINFVVMKFPHDALKDIVAIHPDKNIILKLCKSYGQEPENITKTPESVEKFFKGGVEEKAGACGCSGCEGCKGGCSGADAVKTPTQTPPTQTPPAAQPTAEQPKSFFKENFPLVVLGSLLLIGGLYVLGNKRS